MSLVTATPPTGMRSRDNRPRILTKADICSPPSQSLSKPLGSLRRLHTAEFQGIKAESGLAGGETLMSERVWGGVSTCHTAALMHARQARGAFTLLDRDDGMEDG